MPLRGGAGVSAVRKAPLTLFGESGLLHRTRKTAKAPIFSRLDRQDLSLASEAGRVPSPSFRLRGAQALQGEQGAQARAAQRRHPPLGAIVIGTWTAGQRWLIALPLPTCLSRSSPSRPSAAGPNAEGARRPGRAAGSLYQGKSRNAAKLAKKS